MANKKFIAGVVGLAALLTASEYVRKPVEFTDTLRSYSIEKTDATYGLNFASNYVASATLEDTSGKNLETKNVYHVKGYENFWGRHANSIEKVSN
jgi:hypothetical protein